VQDVFEDDTDVHMVMELCEGPSLTDAVSAGQLVVEEDIAIVMASILRFIAQCHGKGLVYRDVKPDNFIFVRNNFRSPLKATDFGLSIRHRNGESPLTSRSGTPAYMAPEVLSSCIALLLLNCRLVAVKYSCLKARRKTEKMRPQSSRWEGWHEPPQP
jgi:calcium-dependent protein kinase